MTFNKIDDAIEKIMSSEKDCSKKINVKIFFNECLNFSHKNKLNYYGIVYENILDLVIFSKLDLDAIDGLSKFNFIEKINFHEPNMESKNCQNCLYWSTIKSDSENYEGICDLFNIDSSGRTPESLASIRPLARIGSYGGYSQPDYFKFDARKMHLITLSEFSCVHFLNKKLKVIT